MRERNRLVMCSPAGSITFLVIGISAVLVIAWLIVHGGSYRPWLFSAHYQFGFPDLNFRIIEVLKLRRGSNIYVPFGIEAFTYPPVAAFLFLPLTLLSLTVSFLVWTLLTISCLAGAYFVALIALKRRSPLVDLTIAALASVATVVLLPPMAECLAWGQTSTILLLLVTLDVLMIRGRAQGLLVGTATAIKLYPGLFIAFWLFRQKWGTAATAVISFLALTATAWILWPRDASTFFFQILLKGDETSHFNSGPAVVESASISGFLHRISPLPDMAAAVLIVLASLLILIVGLAAAVRLDRAQYNISALVTLLFMTVVLSPVAWDHYFTFAPLLVFVIFEVGFKSILGRASLIALLSFLVPWFMFRRLPGSQPNLAILALGQSGYVLLARNVLLMASLLVIGAAWAQSRSISRRIHPVKVPLLSLPPHPNARR